MADAESDRGRARSLQDASQPSETGPRMVGLVLRVLLVIAVVWLIAIAVSLLTGPEVEAPGDEVPAGESPGGTRPALRAETIALGPDGVHAFAES